MHMHSQPEANSLQALYTLFYFFFSESIVKDS